MPKLMHSFPTFLPASVAAERKLSSEPTDTPPTTPPLRWETAQAFRCSFSIWTMLLRKMSLETQPLSPETDFKGPLPVVLSYLWGSRDWRGDNASQGHTVESRGPLPGRQAPRYTDT